MAFNNSTTSVGDSTFDGTNTSNFPVGQSLDYSTIDDCASSHTGRDYTYRHQDATDIVHEMHLALLYLLSNPDEFKKSLNDTHPHHRGATTLDEWNADIEDEDDTESVLTAGGVSTALPYIVFADDAEVVLPQAHTASQLFGIEKIDGIELEAAAGIPALSQLFLRWLALMPGGDHLNIIDPPGLTVMKIAGARYRVTAAHRVVWTWKNEFASIFDEKLSNIEESPSHQDESSSLQIGDLVTLTIVDVFETDNQGKLLSYCPTFDNRDIRKTNQTTETIRKSSRSLFSILGRAQKAVAKSEVNKRASKQISKMGLMEHARNFGENVKHKVDEAVQQINSPTKAIPTHVQNSDKKDEVTDSKEFEQAISAAAEEAAAGTSRGNLYVSAASSDVGDATSEASVARV